MLDARNYSAPESLTDGTPVIIRAIRPGDKDSILAAFSAMDRESIYTRFFAYKKELTSDELMHITDVDFERVVALVVTTSGEQSETLVGGGRYAVLDDDPPFRTAELAFVTEEGYRGRGVAPLLLNHLERIARERGVTRFEAEVLPQNHAMLSVFRRSGHPMTSRVEAGTVHVVISLSD